MDSFNHDYDTKLSAHELIMYRNGLQDFIIEGDCTSEERKKIRKEIYGLDLLIEVKTVSAMRKLGIEPA